MEHSKPKSILTHSLPGEIRNQIFDLCILDALQRGKPPPSTPPLSTTGIFNSSREWTPPPYKFIVSVLPQWSGPGCFRVQGIASLPLLFVNKQLYQEVSSLVYSKVEEVSIGPYGLQYRCEDPNVRWECAYNLLRKRIHLLKHAKNVKVFLPWLRDNSLQNYWKSLGYKLLNSTRVSHACAVLPKLADFLRAFESLKALKIVIVAEIRDPPDFTPLLVLSELYGCGLTVEIIEPYNQGSTRDITAAEISRWIEAWNMCLAKYLSLKALDHQPAKCHIEF